MKQRLVSWIYLLIFSAPMVAYANIDTVTVDGVDWAQPILFQDLSWQEINDVCPTGSGGNCNGTLNDQDVSGFTWAGIDEVNSLFNKFLSDAGVTGSDLLSGVDSYGENYSSWAPAFFGTGFIPTQQAYPPTTVISGFPRDFSLEPPNCGLCSPVGPPFVFEAVFIENGIERLGGPRTYDYVTTYLLVAAEACEYCGAWLYREDSVDVPAPPMLGLLAIGLVSIALRNRRQRS